MEYIQPEPHEIPIECDCFDEPFTVDKKVLVVDNSRASKHATLMALGMIAGLASSFDPRGSFNDHYHHIPKPKREHIPHTGEKERERRMKRLANRKDT